LARKSFLTRYRQLNVWSKVSFWGAVVTVLSFAVWLISLSVKSKQPAASATTVTQGTQSTIYQANRDVIINSVPSSSPPPATEQPSEGSVRRPQEQSRASNRKSAVETQPSRHVSRARTLYAQGKDEEALAECDAALRMNPHNSEAAILRKRIARTIRISNRQ
jgi:hypothetical protein